MRQKVNFESGDSGNALAEAVLAAAEQAGLPRLTFNQDGIQRAGAGWFDINKRGILRDSSSVAYLHPLSQWGTTLTFYLNQYITRILVENGRAVGVQTAEGPVYAEREVIVACGAFDSPKLLLNSGIGPADHLRSVGVPVVHDLPGVGEHLLDHPEGVVNWELSQPMPPEAINFWEVGIFDKTEPGTAGARPDDAPGRGGIRYADQAGGLSDGAARLCADAKRHTRQERGDGAAALQRSRRAAAD